MKCCHPERCRYWSERIARAGGGTTNPTGAIEALCLNRESPHFSAYTTKRMGCDFGEEGEPVDLRW